MTDVYLDEKFIGKIDNADEFIKNIREERRRGKLPSALKVSTCSTIDRFKNIKNMNNTLNKRIKMYFFKTILL